MVKQPFGDRVFDAIVHALLALVLLIVLYPLVFIAVASISNPAAVLGGEVWLWPKGITFEGYRGVFGNHDIMNGYGNTILYTVTGTAINLLMTLLAAYPLSRKDFYGRNAIMGLFVFTIFFSGGLIPTYLLIKNLGMVNTLWVMIVPNAVSIWNIVIMRTFFQQSIPEEVQEAARIDGCSNLQTMLKIVIPLSMPIIAVMLLFYSVGHWNAYFNALIYLSKRELFPLQLILREILIQNNVDEMVSGREQAWMATESIKYAVVIVANLPVLLLYPFLQRYFVKGMVIGAIKG